MDSLVTKKGKSKENGQQPKIRISTIQMTKQNAPSHAGSLEGRENAISMVPVDIKYDTHESVNNDSLQAVIPGGSSCSSKIKKLKKLSEDVIFKTNFKRAIEDRYSN